VPWWLIALLAHLATSVCLGGLWSVTVRATRRSGQGDRGLPRYLPTSMSPQGEFLAADSAPARPEPVAQIPEPDGWWSPIPDRRSATSAVPGRSVSRAYHWNKVTSADSSGPAWTSPGTRLSS
jgi:hypothetical protein